MAFALATVHVAGGAVKGIHGVPRSWVLSAGSGVSTAYVFVHLLPELAEIEDHLPETLGGSAFGYVEAHAWIVALIGLAVFYGLELAARRSRNEGQTVADGPDSVLRQEATVFWLHVVSYALYNGIVGHLLVDLAEQGPTSLALFSVAMGVHFLVNDHGLREHHGDSYERLGRWVVAAGILAGWLVGAVTTVSEAALGLLLAFLAGGVTMNVMKEELPEDRNSRWTPFMLGAAAYAPLLLAI
jgi:hypothetical protein